MAARAGLEPTTYGLEGSCSIQLSYRAWNKKCNAHTMNHNTGFSRNFLTTKTTKNHEIFRVFSWLILSF